jgi:hypothetical protein
MKLRVEQRNMDLLHRLFGGGAHTVPHDEDFLARLKRKYEPLLARAEGLGARLDTVRLEGERLVVEGTAPSAAVRDTILRGIEALDANRCETNVRIRIGT